MTADTLELIAAAAPGMAAAAAQTARLASTKRKLDERDRELRTDRSTGIPNRRALDEEFDAYRRLAGHQQVSLLMLDLNGLKAINDSHGHPVADEVIADVAAKLNTWTVDRFGFAARLHGDEFAVLLRDTTAAAADTAAQQLRDALTYKFDTPAATIKVSVAIGTATAAVDTTNLSALLKRADQTMYTDKNNRLKTRSQR